MVAATVVASAAEQTITIRDWTGRGFAPEVISYDVPSAGAWKLRVTGPNGSSLPVQIMAGATKARSVLLFPADLPKDATMTYKVSDSGKAGPAEVGIRSDGDTLVLTNTLLAVRVPRVQQRKGVAGRNLPAPIVAFQSSGGPWRGAGRMVVEWQWPAMPPVPARAALR